ncbi:hypothetical protein ABK040_002968 [Willaertia magna]
MSQFSTEIIVKIASFLPKVNDLLNGSLVNKQWYGSILKNDENSLCWKYHAIRLSPLNKKILNTDKLSYQAKVKELLFQQRYELIKVEYTTQKQQYIILQELEFPSNLSSLEKNSIQLIKNCNTFLNYNLKKRNQSERILKCFNTIIRVFITMTQFHKEELLYKSLVNIIKEGSIIFGNEFYTCCYFILTNNSKIKPVLNKEQFIQHLLELNKLLKQNLLLQFLLIENDKINENAKNRLIITIFSYSYKINDELTLKDLINLLKQNNKQDEIVKQLSNDENNKLIFQQLLEKYN